MKIAQVTESFSVSPQVLPEEAAEIASLGFKSVINNRPDGEQPDQPASAEVGAAMEAAGMAYLHLPIVPGQMSDEEVKAFSDALHRLPKPILGFCRSGTRSISLFTLADAGSDTADALIARADKAGYDVKGLKARLEQAGGAKPAEKAAPAKAAAEPAETFDVLIIGGGAAGIAVASSLMKRRRGLAIAIVEPSDKHHYQAAFTLVGGGVFDPKRTVRDEKSCIPAGVKWIHAACAAFEPEQNRVVLEDGERVGYRYLIVCPGIKLDWAQVDGLMDTLGKNGVTSNYLPGMAPYTWELVQAMKGGTALFTQPPMPIKCAGAPQKIMYLACDYWRQQGTLNATEVEFNNAGGVLFGVEAFVPPLMEYVEKYGAKLAFNSRLVAVDGPGKKATFEVTDADGKKSRVEKSFDMLHICPPQTAPDFIRQSPLADDAGWVAVDQETLRSTKFDNVYGLGDACSTPNAKTAAAVRKQAPVVVQNLLKDMGDRAEEGVYDGYGACPLTVQRGKVVLAEFGYGGKLLPSFPLNPRKARWVYWVLKKTILPFMYWDVLLKGRQWGAEAKTRAPKA